MTDKKDIDKILKILEDNSDLDFVQRILSPENYPNITSKQDNRLKKGQSATHQMAWGQNAPDGEATEFYVYPNIVNDNGSLHWFGEGSDAEEYAAETNERIVFDNKEDAAWFSKNYKLIWPEKAVEQ